MLAFRWKGIKSAAFQACPASTVVRGVRRPLAAQTSCADYYIYYHNIYKGLAS
jgi:hypothetical protein